MGVNEASFCSPPVKFTHAIVEPSLLRLPLGLLLAISYQLQGFGVVYECVLAVEKRCS